jgi:hypothetical protein
MTRQIPTAERISRARSLIKKARDFPVPYDTGWGDFAYVAQIKDLMRQARDLIKYFAYNPAISAEFKAEALKIFHEIDAAEKEILRK